MNKKVVITGINTSNIKVLKQQEIKDLFIEMNKGNKQAREELINGNLKLVLSLLKRFNNKNENLDDLFQIGCIGLVKAIDNFDISYDVKFSTYAVPMILGEIRRYIRDNNSIRISRSIKDVAYKVLKLKDELTVKNGYVPSNKDLADILNIEEKDIMLALESLQPTISLFEPIYNDGGDTIYLCDQVSDKKQEKDINQSILLNKAINNLSEREKYIINERYIIGRTQMEVASMLNISQAQISRLEKEALVRVRKQL